MPEIIDLYDLLGNLNSPIHHIGGLEATNELLDMISLKNELKVLDVGCGSGFTACNIVKDYGCQVTGIDASEVMIGKAQERAKKSKVDVDFRVADIYKLPFVDEFFDVGIFESVLNVLPSDRQKAINEVVRVIRPGGLVGGNEVITNQNEPTKFLKQIKEYTPFLGTFFTISELKELFNRATLQIEVVKEYPASKITSRMVYKDVLKTMGLTGLVFYMGKMFYYYLRYPILRQYSKYSRSVLRDKQTKNYFGYALIIGRKE